MRSSTICSRSSARACACRRTPMGGFSCCPLNLLQDQITPTWVGGEKMAPTPAHRKSRATIQEVPIAPHGPIWTWQGGWAGARRRSQRNRCKDGLVDPMPSGGSSYRTPICSVAAGNHKPTWMVCSDHWRHVPLQYLGHRSTQKSPSAETRGDLWWPASRALAVPQTWAKTFRNLQPYCGWTETISQHLRNHG